MSASPSIQPRIGAADPLPPDNRVSVGRSQHPAESLYRTEAAHLTRFFERRVPRDDVRDFVQESFRRILKHRPANPSAFLGRTAVNLVREARRAGLRRKRELHASLDEHEMAGPDPHPQLEARDALSRVDRAMHALKPKTRDIFLMSRIEGKSYAEIAAQFGMSEEGVKKQVAKAMDILRRRVGDL